MEKSKPISTPTTVSCKLSMSMSPQTEEEISYTSRVPYSNAVSYLMYVMVCTKPDLAHLLVLSASLYLNLGKNINKE